MHIICKKCLDLDKNWISRTTYIQWKIGYIIYVRNVWICREFEYPKLRKFDGKLCTFYTYDMSRFAEKLNIQNWENWMGNCVHYMHGLSGLAEKLNIPYRLYSMGNCVHYICTECLDLQKNCISRTTKIQHEIVYNIYVRKVTICWKIEYLELRKFIGKLCTLYICMKCLDLQKN